MAVIHRQLNYPEGDSYGPIGRCIYSGNDYHSGPLSREHIIPRGLNGTMTLLEASCPSCAQITAEVETFCLHQMLIDARTHLGLSHSGQRKKKPRPPLKVGHLGADDEVGHWQELSSNKHPFALVTVDYAPAGILCERKPGEDGLIEFTMIPSPSFASRMSKLPMNSTLNYRVDTDRYARMLAKIAHCFAVRTDGLGSFEPTLLDIILGRTKDIFYYVGGIGDEPPPMSPKGALHTVGVKTENGLVVVTLRLFAYLNAPTYRIVAGRCST